MPAARATSRTACSSSTRPGAIAFAGPSRATDPAMRGDAIDLRPWVLLPGMVDLHAHLPQLPNAGLGAGLDLLTWLERYIFPLERGFDDADRGPHRAGRVARLRRGRDHDRARLRRGLRGEPRRHVPGGRGARDPRDRRQGDDGSDHVRRDHRPDHDPRPHAAPSRPGLIERWHGADDGRLQYAVTPRFAISCTAELLRESAALAASTGAYWQTHVSEDRGEIAEVARLFPEAIDYVDVYDRAGGLGPRTVLAHAVHLLATASWLGSSRRARASPIARSRTCSSPRG